MAGMNQGLVGRIGRFLTTKTPGSKRLHKVAFGSENTGLIQTFAKDPPNPYAPTTTPIAPAKGEANKKGVRRRIKSPRVNSVITPDSTRTQYDILGGK
jgi:hypothetical protein